MTKMTAGAISVIMVCGTLLVCRGKGGVAMVASARKPIEEGASGERGAFYAAARRVLLAGVGAVALAQDELEDFVAKLVDRGELAEKEGKSLLGEMRQKRKAAGQRVEVSLERQLDEALAKLNVPTKSDVDRLTESVAKLSEKVDELAKGGPRAE